MAALGQLACKCSWAVLVSNDMQQCSYAANFDSKSSMYSHCMYSDMYTAVLQSCRPSWPYFHGVPCLQESQLTEALVFAFASL